MRAAHGLLLTFGLSIGALAGVLMLRGDPGGGEDPTRPDRGVLAPPPERPLPTVVVARLGGEVGRVVDVAATRESVAILGRHQWFLQRGDTLLGGFGDPTAGSPDWLSRPESIAMGDGRVYVLDAGRRVLSVWETSGFRVEDIPLVVPAIPSVQTIQVVVGPDGVPVVLFFLVDGEGRARWEARAYRDRSSGEVLFSLEGQTRSFAFHRPHLATGGALLLGMQAESRAVFRVAPGSPGMEPYLQPPDPPLWAVPPQARARYDALVHARGGSGYPALLELPPYWPAVRDLTLTPQGLLLVATPAGEERQHLELLDSMGNPLLRFNDEGFLDPVFLDGGRAFLVREEMNETVLHEFLFEEP